MYLIRCMFRRQLTLVSKIHAGGVIKQEVPGINRPKATPTTKFAPLASRGRHLPRMPQAGLLSSNFQVGNFNSRVTV